MNKTEKIYMNYGDDEANCGTCEHSDSGVCDFAGEISTYYMCNKYEKRDK